MSGASFFQLCLFQLLVMGMLPVRPHLLTKRYFESSSYSYQLLCNNAEGIHNKSDRIDYMPMYIPITINYVSRVFFKWNSSSVTRIERPLFDAYCLTNNYEKECMPDEFH